MSSAAPSGRGTVRIFDDATGIAAAAAEDLLSAAEAALFDNTAATAARVEGAAASLQGAGAVPAPASDERRFSLALAGGSTPRALYQLLAAASGPYRARFPWERAHFFWGDERHVPPDHPESNYRMAREAMLDRVPVAPANIHRIPAEMPDAEQAAAAYEQELRGFFALAAHAESAALPRFDYILLGLGEEGHTASLFPGSAVLDEIRRWVAAPWVEAQHTFRITLTPPVLNQAARVVFLVSGAQKAAALREVLEGERRPRLYPAQIVAPTGGELLWLIDRAAASRLGS